MRKRRNKRQIEDEQHRVAEVHARHESPEERRVLRDEERPRLEPPEHQRGEQDRGRARAWNAERQQRDERAAGLVVVGALRRGDAFDHTGAELARAPGCRFLEAVGQERCDRRAAARQDADQETDHGAVQEGEPAVLEVLRGRQEVAQPLRHRQQLRSLAQRDVGEHLADREHADRDDDEVDTGEEFHLPEGEARGGAEEVGAHARDPQADERREQRLDDRSAGEQHDQREAKRHQPEVLGRAEREREPGERRRDQHQPEHADRAGDERGDRGDAERGAGAAPARHLVAVEAGHDRGGFAGNVEQDRRRRAAVLGAVVDAREHDHRRRGRHLEREREQHRDRRRRPEPGHDADDGPEQHADEAPQQVRGRERDREPLGETGEDFHLEAERAGRQGHAERHREDEVEPGSGGDRDRRRDRERAAVQHGDDEEGEEREAHREADDLARGDRSREGEPRRSRPPDVAPVDPAAAARLPKRARGDEG